MSKKFKRISMLMILVLFFTVMGDFSTGLNIASADEQTSTTYFEGENLVVNPSFENGTTGWIVWGTSLYINTETAHDGTHSAKMYKSGSENAQLLQNIKVKPGRSYRFSAWIRVPSNQTLTQTLQLTDPGNNNRTDLSYLVISYSIAEDDPSFRPNRVNGLPGDGHTVWKNIKCDVTIPPVDDSHFTTYNESDINTYPNLCIYYFYGSGGAWNRYVYFDDISLKEILPSIDGNFVNYIKFYQNGTEITSGYAVGKIAVQANLMSGTYMGKNPILVVAVYKPYNKGQANENAQLITWAYEKSTVATGTDGTRNITTMVDITQEMLDDQCFIEAFVWDDIDNMQRLSNVYRLNY